jgi:predicted DNA-binding ribbon-helix-helix protein
MTKHGPLKRSITISGHRTSLSLEDEFWKELKEIASQRGISSAALIEQVDTDRQDRNLSSALRVFVLHHLKQ